MPGSLVCCVENEAEDRGKARQNRRRPQAAEMMDTLDRGVDGGHFEKGVIIAQRLLGTFSRWIECTWPF